MNVFSEILEKYWGYTTFRPLQEEVIDSISKGKDTLALMPTGGGKSLTFQVPTMAMDGICLVVTPLIALMKDQVDNLKRHGIKALSIYSGMSRQEIIITLENAILGDYKFLYVSPERLSTDLFLMKLKSMNVCLLVVDEAHCISQWGYDFRPSYSNIVSIREHLPHVPVLALTATATPEVVDDIQVNLKFKEKNVLQKSFERTNLAYLIHESEDKVHTLLKLLKRFDGCTIVYVRSRKRTQEIATDLKNAGYAADFYHAGLKGEEKNRKQNAWKNDECRIIVTTNAFGMGIDKPNVRLVVHMDLPNAIEEYFQEAGRAGRDEQKAYAVVLHNKTDSTKLKKRITDEFPEREFILKVYESLAYFLQIAEGFGMGTVYDFNFQQFCFTFKLPLLPTHNALKILDLAGYIQYTEEVESRSRLLFTVYRDELYQRKLDKTSSDIVNILLRLYTGLFTDYSYVNEDALAVQVGKTRKEVYETLKALSKQGILDYIPHKKTPFIIYTQPRLNTKYLAISRMVYEDRKERFKARIESMIDYVGRENVCRNRILLNYFGEDKASDCGQCDVCIAKQRSELNARNKEILSQEIKLLVSKKAMTINELIETLSKDFDEKDIVATIRFQLDQGFIVLDIDKLHLP